MTNAKMAIAKYNSQGLRAWDTYTSGAYSQYMAKGGVIREPVTGVGHRSGMTYHLGEKGPETVTPGIHKPGGDGASSAAMVRALAETNARLDKLISVTAQVPAVFGQVINGAARAGAQLGAYRVR